MAQCMDGVVRNILLDPKNRHFDILSNVNRFSPAGTGRSLTRSTSYLELTVKKEHFIP